MQEQEANQAFSGTSRKRPRSDDALDRSPQQPAEAQVSEPPDALHVHLSSGWGAKRPRTKIGGGLQDPGTPAGADLAASSTAFLRQDVVSFADAEDDFPAFDDAEIAWLMGLFT